MSNFRASANGLTRWQHRCRARRIRSPQLADVRDVQLRVYGHKRRCCSQLTWTCDDIIGGRCHHIRPEWRPDAGQWESTLASGLNDRYQPECRHHRACAGRVLRCDGRRSNQTKRPSPSMRALSVDPREGWQRDRSHRFRQGVRQWHRNAFHLRPLRPDTGPSSRTSRSTDGVFDDGRR